MAENLFSSEKAKQLNKEKNLVNKLNSKLNNNI